MNIYVYIINNLHGVIYKKTGISETISGNNFNFNSFVFVT